MGRKESSWWLSRLGKQVLGKPAGAVTEAAGTSCRGPMLVVGSIFGQCYQELGGSRPHPQTLSYTGSQTGDGRGGSHFCALACAEGQPQRFPLPAQEQGLLWAAVGTAWMVVSPGSPLHPAWCKRPLECTHTLRLPSSKVCHVAQK